MTWNGNNLLTRFSQKFGLTDTTSKTRVLEWMNEIQEDICGEFNYPFLKTKLTKRIAAGTQEVDLAPEVPTALTSAIASGGSLTDTSTYQFKTAFLFNDESGKEENSIESEVPAGTTAITATSANKTASLTNIPVFKTDTLEDATGKTLSEDFTDDTGFTYDNTKAEFTGGLIRQKSQVPATSTFGANYGTVGDSDGSWGNGVLTGTESGTVVVVDGKLDLTDSGVDYVSYAAADNVPITSVGTIEGSFIPNYSGSPASDHYFFTMTNGAGFTNILYVYHKQSDGYLYFVAFNSSGVQIFSMKSINQYVAVAGTAVHIEIDLNLAGTSYFFVDGVAEGSSASTGTRTQTTFIYIGTGRAAGESSDMSAEYWRAYSDVQHTAGFTPVGQIEVYAESTVNLPSLAYPTNAAGEIQAFSGFSATEVDTPTYVINDKYWDGSAWVTSVGSVAQSNTEADVNTNIASLTAADTVDVDIIFAASDTIQASVAQLDVTYTGQSYSVSNGSVYRRIYMSKDGAAYFLVTTLEDNSTQATSITAEATGTIEPPEYSRVSDMSNEEPVIESLNVKLRIESLGEIKSSDPATSSSGTPCHYARLAKDRIFIYPKPSTEIVLTYYVYKIPSHLFDDVSRTIQMSPKLKKVLDAGVYWKGLEYKDSEGQEGKLNNYEIMKVKAIESFGRVSGKFQAVRDVDGDWQGYEV